MIASVEDLSHYAIAQLNEGHYGDASVLSPQGIATLHNPAISTGEKDHYAMGWNVSVWEGVPLVFHNGDPGNFHSDVILMPENGSGIVLLTNSSGFVQFSQADQIAAGVTSLLIGKTPAPISVPFLTRFLYWAILLTPLLLILSIVLIWRNRQHIKRWGILLVVVLNLIVVFGLFALSLNIPFPIASLRVFFPDVAYGLIAVAVLGIGWSVIYVVISLTKRITN